MRGLDRQQAPDLVADGVEWIRGDIADPAAAARFARGLHSVIHTAARVQEDGPLEDFRHVNVKGSAVIAEAARSAGVRRFVQLSSVMVYGFDYHDGITESGPFDGANNPYCITKIESEAAVLAQSRPGFEVVVVRPGDVYGPGSVPWTLRPVRMMKRHQWLFVDSRRSLVNHVFIDNLVDAILLLEQVGEAGSAYNVTDGVRTTTREFFSFYQELLGIRYLPELPSSLALRALRVAERAATRFDKSLDVNASALAFVLRRGLVDSGRVRQLGFRPRIALDAGMARTARWLREQGEV